MTGDRHRILRGETEKSPALKFPSQCPLGVNVDCREGKALGTEGGREMGKGVLGGGGAVHKDRFSNSQVSVGYADTQRAYFGEVDKNGSEEKWGVCVSSGSG